MRLEYRIPQSAISDGSGMTPGTHLEPSVRFWIAWQVTVNSEQKARS